MTQPPPEPTPSDVADPDGERRKLEGFGAEILLSFVERVIAKHDGQDTLGLRREAREIVTGGNLTKIAGLAANAFENQRRQALLRKLRRDAFGRLVCKPIAPLFEDGSVSRELVHGIRAFIRMLIGKEQEFALSMAAQATWKQMQIDNPDVTWKQFYAHPDMRAIWWRILVTLPAAFRQFESRLGRMVLVLNTRAGDVALSGNAYVHTHHAQTIDLATESEALAILRAWVKTGLGLDAEEKRQFAAATGHTPDFEALAERLDLDLPMKAE
ncbi:MAG: hypothetical protein J0H39_00585 [Alphaproteobacteria bacterium]|nr:hypothetical protein [Alphaproteobacteria bacterium]